MPTAFVGMMKPASVGMATQSRGHGTQVKLTFNYLLATCAPGQ